MILFILEYLFFILAAVFLIPALWFFDDRSFKTSGFWMLACIASLATFYWDSITALIAAEGYISAAIQLMLFYVVGGVVTSFVYWVFYCWRVRERFDRACSKVSDEDVRQLVEKLFFKNKNIPKATEYVLQESFKTKLIQFLASKDSSDRDKIFENYSNQLDIPYSRFSGIEDKNTVEDIEAGVITAVNSVFPPRFAMCKPFVIAAALEWPLTLLWLALHRVIKQLIERFITLFKGGFDRLSKFCFGKF